MEIETETDEKKGLKAKAVSLIAQIIAALWIAFWSGKKFLISAPDIMDIIISGCAIAACFSPVYFNMVMDKINTICSKKE